MIDLNHLRQQIDMVCSLISEETDREKLGQYVLELEALTEMYKLEVKLRGERGPPSTDGI